MALKYIDLFAGCGGLSLGLHNAGWEGIFAVEKNDDAFSTLKFNLIDNIKHFKWPDWISISNHDINDILATKSSHLKQMAGTIDLVVGGPPCQGFSMAGLRKSGDYRNKLSHSYLEFIKLVRPKVVFLENVHGFTVGFKKDEDIKGTPYSKIIVDSLKDIGYNVTSALIDVSEYGVPQKRIRFILVGIRDSESNKFFETLQKQRNAFLESNKLRVPITVGEAVSDLQEKHGTVICPDSIGFKSGIYGEISSAYQTLMRKDVTASSPDSHRFVKHKETTVDVFTKLMGVSKEVKRVTPKQAQVDGFKKRAITPLKADGICYTVTSIPDDYIHFSEPRVLTVRELARFQSFPDWFEFKGKYTTGGERRRIEVPRYTQVANAVPPLFAEQVGLAIKELL